MAVLCQYGPKESLAGFQKFFLLWVPMNSQQYCKAKLERAYSFRVRSGKITVCSLTFLICRVQAIMGHVQTIYNYASLDANMCLDVNSIDYYQGTLEASGTDLEYVFQDEHHET